VGGRGGVGGQLDPAACDAIAHGHGAARHRTSRFPSAAAAAVTTSAVVVTAVTAAQPGERPGPTLRR
jgi:hypothetical protein